MTQLSTRQWIGIAISAAASALAIYLTFRGIDFDELGQQLRQARLGYVVGLILAYPIGMILRIFRWPVLLEAPLPFWRAFHLMNVAYLFNTVLPFRAGEVVRVLLNSREDGQTVGASMSAATVERLFDLLFALACVGMGLVLVPTDERLPASLINSLVFFIIVTVLGMGVLLFLPRSHPFLLSFARGIFRPLPARVSDSLLRFTEDTLSNLGIIATPRRVVTVFLWTMATWAGYVAFFYVSLFAFFDSAPLGVGFLIIGFVALGGAAPSLPGAIGVFQGAAILALQMAGYNTEAATGYAWVVWFAQSIVTVLIGVIGLAALGLSFGQLAENVLEESEGRAQA